MIMGIDMYAVIFIINCLAGKIQRLTELSKDTDGLMIQNISLKEASSVNITWIKITVLFNFIIYKWKNLQKTYNYIIHINISGLQMSKNASGKQKLKHIEKRSNTTLKIKTPLEFKIITARAIYYQSKKTSPKKRQEQRQNRTLPYGYWRRIRSRYF